MTKEQEMMAAAFRFKIGDAVVDRVTVGAYREDLEFNHDKPRRRRDVFGDTSIGCTGGMVVLGRVMEECHGGVQLHYKVRRYLSDDKSVIEVWDEIELAPRDEALAVVREIKARRSAEEEKG